jgi:serine/threonine protein kinase
MAEISVGTEIAGYRIESVIGRGGMAVVYRAEDTRLGRKVALKLLAPVLAENEQFQQRFIRESRLAASLDHPNIVPIYEAGEADGHLFIAMRYVPGSDLKALLAKEGRLAPARLLRLFVQVGDALDAAHVLGLVHRDVKPGNILVTSVAEHSGHAHPDHVYLTDFGLTKRTTSLSGSLTGTGHFLGTVDYVSPEQIQGAPVGPGTDIYALGCVLYECLTGQLPFHRDDDAAMLWAHLVEMPPPVTVARPDLPVPVNDVVARAMAKAPEDRYASCRELLRDMEYALNYEKEPTDVDRTPSRQGARHSHPADERGKVSEGGAPLVAGTGTSPGTTARPAPDPDAEATLAQRWESHPSLPPGAMGPLPWQNAMTPPAEASPPSAGTPAGPAGEGVDEDQEYDDEGQLWNEEEQASSWDENGAASATSGSRRRWLPIAAAAVVVALVAVAGALFLRSREDAVVFRTYTSSDTVVPYSMSYPDTWTVERGVASDVVLAPRPDAVAATFFLQTSQENAWTGTRNLLRTSRAEVIGTYIYAATSGAEPTAEGLRSAISARLPNSKLAFGSTHGQVPIGGAPAHQLEGTVSDPSSPGTQLRAMFDLVLPEGGGSVLITYFAPPHDFEEQRPVFTKMRESLRFTG